MTALKSYDRKLTGEMVTALAKFAAEVKNPTKNSENSHLRNSYADLGEVVRVIRPVLGKYGLALIQGVETLPDYSDQETGEVVRGGEYLRTLLAHESGGYIETLCRVPYADPGRGSLAQAIGSAVTYMRRYQALAVCGVAADDDDDGQAAGNVPSQSSQRGRGGNGQRQGATPPPPPSVDVPDDLRQRISSIDTPEKAKAAREWLSGSDSGLSEQAQKKALGLLDEQEKKIGSANQGGAGQAAS